MQDNTSHDIIKSKYLLTPQYLKRERTRKFINIALTLFVLSLFGFFAINPTISTILKLRKELDDSRFAYNQLETKIRNLSALRTQYDNLQTDLPVITDAISEAPDVHLLFAQIQALARNSNVKIKRLQNFEVEVIKSSKGPKKPYYSYSFSISGNGSFENIHNFVSTIISMQRIVNIETFNINTASNQIDSQTLTFNIQAAAFFKE